MTVIWWMRRDLRLRDNQALQIALEQGEDVLPTFILDPALLESPYVGEKRLAFLFGGLHEIDKALRRRGSYLILRQGKPSEQLNQLTSETGASAIFAERDYSPYARRRDEGIKKEHKLNLVEGCTIFPVDLIYKKDGTPYTVYTPYSKRWKELAMPEPESLLSAPSQIMTPSGVKRVALPNSPSWTEKAQFPPGEHEAQRRLNLFLDGNDGAPVTTYAEDRNRMDLDGTSKLSPYLRFGMISARQATVAAIEKRSTIPDAEGRHGAEVWLNELIWREFYMSILYHFPRVLRGNFQRVYDGIKWQNDQGQFRAWCNGETGYPVVDAAMRQLVQTGWMHNRARMIVASFLVKDLLIDWRWGEKWFMQHLVDGDPAANNGGWQWTAGTGTDAAPYFRIFNPVTQGKKFDPNGLFVRRWLPELTAVPDKYVHEPWTMASSLQKKVNCVIGRHYPKPIVDHSAARQATLDAFAEARQSN